MICCLVADSDHNYLATVRSVGVGECRRFLNPSQESDQVIGHGQQQITQSHVSRWRRQ